MELEWSVPVGFGPGGTFEFPEADGVYVIAKITNGKPRVVYVGQGSIRERVLTHAYHNNGDNECLALVMSDLENIQVRFTLIADSEVRDNVEFTYYKYYLTREGQLCNQISPPGTWINAITPPF